MNRMKAALLMIGLISLVALVGCGSAADTQKPLRDLNASDVAAATVRLLPPDITIQIDDTDKLVRLLRKAAVTEPSAPDSDTLSGQNVIYRLDLSNGDFKEIQVFYPYMVIGGISYKAERRSCEALSSYANTILDENLVNPPEQVKQSVADFIVD